LPELPETETIARDLHAEVKGMRITSAMVHRADVLREIEHGALDDAVRGLQIARVWRRAKLVVLDLARDDTSANAPVTIAHLVVQPRFTGAMLLDDGTLPADQLDYLTVTFTLADGRSLHYRDVRRLGTVSFMSVPRFTQYSGGLGPEPLDAEFTSEEFSALVRASRRSIKVLLMDQSRLAGVGNIYANEALWRAGIDPSREAATLTVFESTTLLSELRAVLRASIEARGTSFRDYRDARGQRGAFVAQLAVYGRGGEECLRCGAKLVDTHVIDGRTTVLCAYCQR
jgi:formamidopyrimidine-DNA glycosylase